MSNAPMDLNKIFCAKRTGSVLNDVSVDHRSAFQRDFDRIIFSTPFRRLQNKTQVFPLPGSVLVHNRLTHSLEVASVGRSLGSLVGKRIANSYQNDLNKEAKNFYTNSLYNVISSACLCHDIGNPAFGHSGEDAIASFFKKNDSYLKNQFTESQWYDFIFFEGNANAIRILTHQQNGKAPGGLRLTYSTIAAIAKYPCSSIAKDKNMLHRKKFGFFDSEKETFTAIAKDSDMILESSSPLVFKRHPFVWLVEFADDICYLLMDLDDAHRLKIVATEQCEKLYLNIIADLDNKQVKKVKDQLKKINNNNEKIAYLRAKSIGILIQHGVDTYLHQLEQILSGDLDESILKTISKECAAIKKIEEISILKIYNHKSVLEVENAGYHVMYELLQLFLPPIIKEKQERSGSEKMAVKLIPKQFIFPDKSIYQKTLGILDFVSGMTDNFATDLYKKMKGIEIGMNF